MESQAKLLQQHRCQTPSLQNFNIPKRLAPAYVSTEQHLHGVNYNRGSAGQWQRAYQRRPTPLETQEKRQRQKHAHHWQQLTRAQSQAVDSQQNLDNNQSN